LSWKWSNFPLPEAHIAGTAAGIILQFLYPLRIDLFPQLGYVLAGLAFSSGTLLVVWAVTTAADVDISSPIRLVTSGPFAYSRNPMYVGWTLINLSIAFLSSNPWILLTTVIVFIYTHKFIILKEEQELTEHFGEPYQEY
jgi:protein-S-isoprenylcysteine O-methyltransferase Ste14